MDNLGVAKKSSESIFTAGWKLGSKICTSGVRSLCHTISVLER